MTKVNYAFIKNNNIINVVVFEDPSDELLASFKAEFNLDDIKVATEKAVIGGTYDGSKFWLPQPYPSWIKNEELNEWEAPVPYPIVQDNIDGYYIWDENTISWVLISNSI